MKSNRKLFKNQGYYRKSDKPCPKSGISTNHCLIWKKPGKKSNGIMMVVHTSDGVLTHYTYCGRYNLWHSDGELPYKWKAWIVSAEWTMLVRWSSCIYYYVYCWGGNVHDECWQCWHLWPIWRYPFDKEEVVVVKEDNNDNDDDNDAEDSDEECTKFEWDGRDEIIATVESDKMSITELLLPSKHL